MTAFITAVFLLVNGLLSFQAPQTVEPILVPFELEQLLPDSTWPEHRWEEVAAVVGCESSFIASEVGDGGLALGLMQIRTDYWPHLHAAYDLTDPAQNLDAGRQAFLEWREMFGGSGWGAWSCRP